MNDYANDIPRALAQAAHQGTSFSPERRGESEIAGYASTLAADYADLEAHAIKGGTLDLLPSEFARYRAGLRRRQIAYLQSSSRCVSSFIAGPSNFPARRMNKRAEIAHKRLSEMLDFRGYAKRAAIRNLRPDLRPIMAGDADAVERLQREHDTATRVHARMKAANAAIRKHAKAGPDAQVEALMAQGFTEPRARDLLKPDFCGRIGFADYEITNNGANIRRIAARIAALEQAKAQPDTEREGANGVRMEDSPADNRVRLFFPGKPADDVRAKLKAHGFRWSPTVGAWQAYRNNRSIPIAQEFAS